MSEFDHPEFGACKHCGEETPCFLAPVGTAPWIHTGEYCCPDCFYGLEAPRGATIVAASLLGNQWEELLRSESWGPCKHCRLSTIYHICHGDAEVTPKTPREWCCLECFEGPELEAINAQDAANG